MSHDCTFDASTCHRRYCQDTGKCMRKEAYAPAPRVTDEPPMLPSNHGAPWTNAEEKLLCERFDQNYTLERLADEHGRKTSAIVARLVCLGKLISLHGEYRKLGPRFCTWNDIGRPL